MSTTLFSQVSENKDLKHKLLYRRAQTKARLGEGSSLNCQKIQYWGQALEDYYVVLEFDPEFAKSKAAQEYEQIKYQLEKLQRPASPSIEKTPVSVKPQAFSVALPFSLIPSRDINFTNAKRLGKGGFGEVWQVTWQHTDVAAKKLLVQSFNDQAAEEFKKEAEHQGTLHHPNIVSLYGVCIETGNYCLVMELMV